VTAPGGPGGGAGQPAGASSMMFQYYWLYSVERVGMLLGRRHIGGHDWYKEGATYLLKTQAANGSWSMSHCGTTGGTGLALLFLIRGRHPVLFNKLQHGGDWDRRSRDLAAVTRWTSYNFETEVNWQIIDTKHPVSEWHDASILYITGTTDPKFTDDDLEKIKQFVMEGGMIFTVVQSGGAPFNRAMQAAYAKMFNYSMMPIGKDHVLNHIYFDIAKPAKMSEITNGARPLVVHCDEDLAKTWMSARATATGRQREYEIAFNVTMYGVDKMSALPPRGAVFWPKVEDAPEKTIKVTRVRHGGNWDPEPVALRRFADRMAYYEEIGVEVSEPVKLGELTASAGKIAIMTGAGEVSFSDDEAAAVRKYVLGGGTLVIDAAGGNTEFAASVESMLSRAFGPPKYQLSRLPASSEIYSVPQRRITHTVFRRRTGHRVPDRNPQLKAILVGTGRPGVIFSDLDVTCGLAGVRSGGVYGYEHETAFDLMRNILIHVDATDAPSVADAPADKAPVPSPPKAKTGAGAKGTEW